MLKNREANNGKEILNFLTQHFPYVSSVVTLSCEDALDFKAQQIENPSDLSKAFTKAETFAVLSQLDANKSAGLDSIPSSF